MTDSSDLASVQAYISGCNLNFLPGWKPNSPCQVSLLAQGEYNTNYRVEQGNSIWVLRLNRGSQMNRADQIRYEYNALQLLEKSGFTPCAYGVDDSRIGLPEGILWMEYLPGDPLDYRRDLEDAARLFARLHSHPIPADHGLISEVNPLSMMFEECKSLLATYLESELADPDLTLFFRELLDYADHARHKERFYLSDPWPCLINTEVNSGNFIANRPQQTLHLVDWEKPLWGDPSQDISHFCAPMTTLWKTNYRLSEAEKLNFLRVYADSIGDLHLRDTIRDRVKLRDPFTYLRGIAWSAMAWVNYQTGSHINRNVDTFWKISSYLDLNFLRDLFNPFMEN